MKKAFLLLLFAATAHGQMVVGTLTGTKCVSVEQVTAAARKGLNDAGLTQVTISVVNSGPGSN